MSAKLCPCWSLAYYAMRSYLTHALALSLSLIRVFVWVSGCFQIFADFSIFMNDLILYFHPRSVNSRGAIKWKSNQIKEHQTGDWGSGLRPEFLHSHGIFEREKYGIPLVAWVTAIPRSLAGQYRLLCRQMYRSVPESVSGLHPLYLRHFLLRLSQQMGCETGGNVRISPSLWRCQAIFRELHICRRVPILGPSQLLLANRPSADS